MTRVCVASDSTAKSKLARLQRNRSAEEGNRTLLSSLKTIGRSAVRTLGSGQEAPHDAVTGQRYWPSIGPAPPSAPVARAAVCLVRGRSAGQGLRNVTRAT